MTLNKAREESLARLGEAWTELRGYVGEAVRDGKPVDAVHLASYMDELRRRSHAPIREALKAFHAPEDGA